jgi:hypothetical protein
MFFPNVRVSYARSNSCSPRVVISVVARHGGCGAIWMVLISVRSFVSGGA